MARRRSRAGGRGRGRDAPGLFPDRRRPRGIRDRRTSCASAAVDLGHRGSRERRRAAVRRRGRLPRPDRPALAPDRERGARAARRAARSSSRATCGSRASPAKTRAPRNCSPRASQLDTVTEVADTRSPVELAFGAHRMRAIGMRADLKAGTVRLESERQWPLHTVAASQSPCSPPARPRRRRIASSCRSSSKARSHGLRLPEWRAQVRRRSRSRRAQVRITADRAVTNGLDFEGQQLGVQRHGPHHDARVGLASDTARRARSRAARSRAPTVTGAPATFEQQREDEQAEGRANRIDYDLKRGTVELAGDAWL